MSIWNKVLVGVTLALLLGIGAFASSVAYGFYQLGRPGAQEDLRFLVELATGAPRVFGEGVTAVREAVLRETRWRLQTGSYDKKGNFNVNGDSEVFILCYEDDCLEVLASWNTLKGEGAQARLLAGFTNPTPVATGVVTNTSFATNGKQVLQIALDQ